MKAYLSLHIDEKADGRFLVSWRLPCRGDDHILWEETVDIVKADDLSSALAEAWQWYQACTRPGVE